jgi:hypothetical protein
MPFLSPSAAAAVGGGSSTADIVEDEEKERDRALLGGVVPVFNTTLSAAYGDAVRKVQKEGRLKRRGQEELGALELVRKLKSNGEVQLLALHVLRNLAAEAIKDCGCEAKDLLHTALEAGALGDVLSLAANSSAMLQGSGDILSQSFPALLAKAPIENWVEAYALDQLGSTAELISAIASPEVMTTEVIGTITAAHIKSLAEGIVRSVTHASELDSKGHQGLANKLFDIAEQLIESYFKIEWHDASQPEVFDPSWDTTFSDPHFLRSCLFALNRYPRTTRAHWISRIFRKGSNFVIFGEYVLAINGLKNIIDFLSSTEHDNATIFNLFVTVSNSSYQDKLAENLFQNDALLFLQVRSMTCIFVTVSFLLLGRRCVVNEYVNVLMFPVLRVWLIHYIIT